MAWSGGLTPSPVPVDVPNGRDKSPNLGALREGRRKHRKQSSEHDRESAAADCVQQRSRKEAVLQSSDEERVPCRDSLVTGCT